MCPLGQSCEPWASINTEAARDPGRTSSVVTTNDAPGYRVQQVIGEVFGLTVRSRHLGSQIGAGLKSMIGGELKGLTRTLVETRNQAMERLVEQARVRGRTAC